MQRITKIIVTDASGSTQTFEGEGFLMTTSAQEKNPSGGMAKIVGTQVTANLFIPKED